MTMTGPNSPPTRWVPYLWMANSPTRITEGGRHDIRAEQRRDDFQAFDGAQDRDRRRDHAVAVEQGRSEDAERDEQRPSDRQPRRPAGGAGPARDQRGQREHAAFALVVRAHHDQRRT